MTKTAIQLAVLTAGTLFASLAQATTLSFDFRSGGTNVGSGLGNVRTFNDNDPTTNIMVTATAWSASSSGNVFSAAQAGRATGIGLWDCNASEGVNCASPNHQIDNVSGFDFILLQFSTTIDPSTISIQTYSNADLDVTYYLGNATSGLSLTGVNFAGLAGVGLGYKVNDDVNTGAISRSLTMAHPFPVNSILIGARVGGDYNADYFKISGASVNTVSGVPEPATWAMSGAALAGLAIIRRRRASL